MAIVTRLYKCAGKTEAQKLRICEKLLNREITVNDVVYRVYEAVFALDKGDDFVRAYATQANTTQDIF